MVIKLKGKFFILLVILSLVLSLGLFSTSYASNSTEIIDILDKLGKKGLVGEFIYQTISLPADINSYSYYTIVIGSGTHGVNASVPGIGTDRRLYICYGNKSPITNDSNSPTNGYYYAWNRYQNTYVYNYSTGAFVNQGNAYPRFNDLTLSDCYIYTTVDIDTRIISLGAGEEYGYVIVNVPTSYFTPNHDHVVTQNNIDYNTILRGFSVNQWKIGETTNFNDLDAFQFYFYDLVANVELGYVEGYREADILRGKNCLYFSPPNMYVNSRYIRYDHPYRLDIHKFLDGVETTETYYYLFLPRNAVISNGVIVSPGSGDFNVQDSTNAIIDSQESGDKQIIEALTDDSEVDSILSGEFIASSSGDIKNYAEKFGFTALDNPFTTFLLHLLDETFDALTEPSNVILQADYKGLHFELNSDDFFTPASPLKDFVRNLLIFLYIYGNYRFFNHLIVLIQTAKIDKAIATLGTDEFYDSDIM